VGGLSDGPSYFPILELRGLIDLGARFAISLNSEDKLSLSIVMNQSLGTFLEFAATTSYRGEN